MVRRLSRGQEVKVPYEHEIRSDTGRGVKQVQLSAADAVMIGHGRLSGHELDGMLIACRLLDTKIICIHDWAC